MSNIKQTKNSPPSSEFEHEDRCPSCGSPCNIHTDLDDKDYCNDCRVVSNKKQQSSVEQFAIALYEKGLLIGNGDWMQDILNEYKAMHKEEIIEFAINFTYGTKRVGESIKKDFIKLYNETFGGNNDQQ